MNYGFQEKISCYLADTSFCWAFSISSMLRHSLNSFLWKLTRKITSRFDNRKVGEAIQYLNSLDFHKRLRAGFEKYIFEDCFFFFLILSLTHPWERNELIMIPVPKPRFFEHKVPAGQSEDDYFDVITERQTHILRDAIDRVSNINLII